MLTHLYQRLRLFFRSSPPAIERDYVTISFDECQALWSSFNPQRPLDVSNFGVFKLESFYKTVPDYVLHLNTWAQIIRDKDAIGVSSVPPSGQSVSLDQFFTDEERYYLDPEVGLQTLRESVLAWLSALAEAGKSVPTMHNRRVMLAVSENLLGIARDIEGFQHQY